MGSAQSSQGDDNDQDPWWSPPQQEEQIQPVQTYSATQNAANANQNDDTIRGVMQQLVDLKNQMSQERQELRQHLEDVRQMKNVFPSSSGEFLTTQSEEAHCAKQSDTVTLVDVNNTNECKTDTASCVVQIETRTSTGDSKPLSLEKREELDLLRAQISVQRQARQKKLAAHAAEMDRLRKELAQEKSERLKLQAKLESGQKDGNEVCSSSALDSVLQEVSQLRDDLERERRVKEDITLQKDTMHEHNQQLIVRLEKANQDRQIDEAAAEGLRTENTQLSEIIRQGAEELIKTKAEAENYAIRLHHTQQQVNAYKELLAIRENQVKDMKEKFSVIEKRIGYNDSSSPIDTLREEYQKQISNIKELKQLYENKSILLQQQNEKLTEELEEKVRIGGEREAELQSLQEQVARLESTLSERGEVMEDMEFQLGDSVAECQNLTSQMKRINHLFTQMLLGPAASSEIDLDKLSRLLHENHDLITDITVKGGGSDIAPVLPKLIVDLITQIENEAAQERNNCESDSNQEVESDNNDVEAESPAEDKTNNVEISETGSKETIANEITANLPKVWAVLTELVSQQAGKITRRGSVGDSEKGRSSCYTSVNTPGGPRNVISVSKTYIRLKDLIMEKRALQRELLRLKQLNGHLEARLGEQENRLSQVSVELHKTWGLVGRLEKQHHQLHTHEKILRYELHQKRELLSELKKELEYCREKWESARQKNTQTHKEWRLLRKEFAARKSRDTMAEDDINNSVESGLGEESCEDDLDSVRSESPSAAEDTETTPLSPSPGPTPLSVHGSEEEFDPPPADLPIDHDTLREVSPMQVSIAPVLEHSEQEGEVHSLDLDPMQVVESNAFVTTTEPLVNTLVSSAVVLETETVSAVSESEPEDDNKDVTDLTDLKEKALVRYAQVSASIREEPQRIVEEPTDDRGSCSENEDISPSACEGNRTSQPAALPTFTSREGVQTLPVSNLLFSSFNIDTLDFETDVTTTLCPATIATNNESATNTNGQWAKVNVVEEENGTAPTNPDSCSSQPKPSRSPEEILAAREARLKRMEEQAEWLRNKMANTSQRGDALSNRLEELHVQYGSDDKQPSTAQRRAMVQSKATAPQSDPVRTDTRSPEEILAARAERLDRLEQQCNSLYNQVSRTSHLGNVLSSRLEVLHEQYSPGDNSSRTQEVPRPPPLPEVLPSVRLPTSSSNDSENSPENETLEK